MFGLCAEADSSHERGDIVLALSVDGDHDLQAWVERVLDGYRIPRAGALEYGYRVELAEDGTAVVRWGRGDPFVGDQFRTRGLGRCADLLEREGFELPTPEAGLTVLVRSRRAIATPVE